MITRSEFTNRFNNFVEDMASTLFKKNHDYTSGNDKDDPFYNFRRSENIGVPAWKGALIRFSDKYSRIETFARKGKFEVNDENFEDTIKDAANYLFLILELYREWKNDQIDQTHEHSSGSESIAREKIEDRDKVTVINES